MPPAARRSTAAAASSLLIPLRAAGVPAGRFDYAAPKYFGPSSKRRGVGQHPHRGFETVTIAFSGEIEHADSTGQSDTIRAGDVQWMTAGRGIIHEEFMSTEFSKTGGELEMCQLWLNLPKKYKMSKPGYQAITKQQIPNVALPSGVRADGHVRLIAGDYNSTKGAATTFTPVNLWDIVMATPSLPHVFNIPAGHNTVLFVRRGSIEVSDGEGSSQQLGGQQVAILEQPGTLLEHWVEDGRSLPGTTQAGTCMRLHPCWYHFGGLSEQTQPLLTG